jgi:hypothetical protein
MMLHGKKKVAVITHKHYGVRVYALNKASDLSPWTSTFKIKTSLRKKMELYLFIMIEHMVQLKH